MENIQAACAGEMPEAWLRVLRRQFGHRAFRPGQLEVVNRLMQGQSALAVFPTGGGKSVCYQLPALLLPGPTVVVSPLIALMRDQVIALRQRGVAAARLDSTLQPDEEQEVMRGWCEGSLRLLYMSPERLAIESARDMLRKRRADLLAVDEAHCISEWGHHFRPDYLKLARFREQLGVPLLLALTATATPQVARDICKEFGIADADTVRLGFHRKNLDLRIETCRPTMRLKRLKRGLAKVLERPGSVVVYVTRQETAAMVAAQLAAEGMSARAYHAGLSPELRAETQAAFMVGEIRVIVATIAFGMGIDKADIRLVAHFNMPKSIEGYSQEIGRAGRDGRKAKALWLACPDDITVLENFIFGDTPTERSVRNFVDHVLRLGDRFELSVRELSIACDMREAVARTLLAYLELDGWIEPIDRVHAEYRVKLLRPLSQVLTGRSEEDRALLGALLTTAAEEKFGWLEVQPVAAAKVLSCSEEAVREAVAWLAGGGEAVVQPRRLRLRHRRLRQPGPTGISEVAEDLWRRCVEREERELGRLAKVWQLALSATCLTKTVSEHFGEQMADDCGHCDRCRKAGEVRLPGPRTTREPGPREVELVRALVSERHPALRKPRQMARFLCGLISPAVTHARLQEDERFGQLAAFPFPSVLELCEAVV